MVIEDMESFQAGIKVLDDASREICAELRAMDGICMECAEAAGKVWPEPVIKYYTGPCHSCGDKTDCMLVPYDDMQDI